MPQILGPLYLLRNMSRGLSIATWALRFALCGKLFQPFHMIKCDCGLVSRKRAVLCRLLHSPADLSSQCCFSAGVACGLPGCSVGLCKAGVGTPEPHA